MLLNILFQAYLQALQQRQQLLINSNLIRTNAKRRDFNFQPGQHVLLKDPEGKKLDPKAMGPYLIRQIYTNGTA